MKNNIKVIDACLHLHNFIVDFREEHGGPVSDSTAMERELFDDDCRRFLSAQSGVGSVGVHGGELDVRRDRQGNPSQGGRPSANEAQSNAEGKSMRKRLKSYMMSQRCERPATNWYRVNNRVMD